MEMSALGRLAAPSSDLTVLSSQNTLASTEASQGPQPDIFHCPLLVGESTVTNTASCCIIGTVRRLTTWLWMKTV